MNYVYQNYLSADLDDVLKTNATLNKFVRELHFNFGLLAYSVLRESNCAPKVRLCNPNGVHIANVSIRPNYDKDGNEAEEYNYYSTWYSKSRGSSDNDRRTLRSIKLSSLIATMKRNDVVPSSDNANKILSDLLGELTNNIERAVGKGNTSKSHYDISPDVHHALLKIYLNGESPDLLLRFDRSKLEKVLHGFNEADRLRAEREQAINEKIMSEEMYAVGVTELGDYLVAKFTAGYQEEPNSMYQKMTVNSMKRVKSLIESHSEFIPLLTMFKAANENDTTYNPQENNDGWFIPRMEKYDTNLDMNFAYTSRGYGRSENISWTVFPCSAI